MRKPEKMRNMLIILKDKVSILKATLSFSSKPTTTFHVAVLLATSLHHPEDPPPVDAILALLAQHHRTSAGVLLHALLQRLHGTHSAYVALKCLLTLHYVITHGSPALREQLRAHSSEPLFNLSTFRDESDCGTWELSNWVRWYADVLDHGLSLNREKRLTSLVGMVEKICGAPDSLHYQKLSLVFEAMKLVGEDYRMIMREISAMINNNLFKKKKRIEDLEDNMLGNLLGDLKSLENCREKVLLMFLNKKKNDGVWELIEQVRRDVEEVKKKREKMRLVRFQGTESTRVFDNRVDELKSLAVVPSTRVKRWLDVDWNPLIASSA